MPEVVINIETITPEMALAALGKNDGNRNISSQVVAKYRRDIEADAWVLTHQSVAFGPDGSIVDGQHRLKAIAESGISVRATVARYTDQETADWARLAVDLGRNRRMGDLLEIGQLAERGIGKRVAAISNLILVAERTNIKWPTQAELRDFYTKNKGSVDYAARLPQQQFPTVISAAVAYAHSVNPSEVEVFVKLVSDKIGYEDGSSAHLFVKAMSDGTFAQGSHSGRDFRVQAMHKVLRLIQLHVTGKTLTKLQRGPIGFEYFRDKRAAAGL
jgi:hypothetical protein